jgi:hypothetical protein
MRSLGVLGQKPETLEIRLKTKEYLIIILFVVVRYGFRIDEAVPSVVMKCDNVCCMVRGTY